MHFRLWPGLSDYGQHYLVDFWEKFPTDLDFIWIEQNSYNSGVLFQIVWSCTSIFKLKSSSTEGWLRSVSPKFIHINLVKLDENFLNAPILGSFKGRGYNSGATFIARVRLNSNQIEWMNFYVATSIWLFFSALLGIFTDVLIP